MYRPEVARKLVGAHVVVTTPYDESMNLDIPALKRHVRWLVDSGLREGKAVLIPFGSTGECSSLTLDERKRGLEAFMEAADGKVPVMVGANESGTGMVIDLVKHASSVGAAAAMILPPFYMRPSLEATRRHFQAISDATDLPIIVYNNPDILAMDVPLEWLAEMGKIDHVVGVKECTWIMDKLRLVAHDLGSTMVITNGNGEAQEPFGYMSGTVGFVSAMANFAPRLSLAVHEAGVAGDVARGMELYHNARPWNQMLTSLAGREGGGQAISMVKATMEVMGWPSMKPRLPIYPLSSADMAALRAIMDKMDLVDRCPFTR
jgi:dihydrodipicolinate synthase/N-acetylneuraminate lyase